MAEIKIFHNGNGIDVSGVFDFDSNGVTLFKGSKISSTEKDTFKIIPDVQRTYHKYLETGIIKDSILTQDCTFTSPFFAASIANLSRVNGRSFFVSEEGYPLSRYIFINYLKNNINNDDSIEGKAKNDINEFNKLFPLKTLGDLPIEKYDYRAENGEQNNAFINWIEKRTDSLGSGHLASNYNKLFYREKTKSDYDILSSLKPLLSKYNTDIRGLYKIFIKGLADFIKAYDEENYKSTEDYPCKDFLERSNVIKMKVLLLYQKPLFGITTLLNVKSLLTDLGVKFDKNNMDVIEGNILLKNELFKALPELKDKSTYVISKCLREYIHWAGKDTSGIPGGSKQEKKDENILPSTTSNPNMSTNKISLNTILYGVPGTGKTYNTVNYAVSAIEGKNLEDVSREEWTEVKKRYDQYKSEGQIVFTTFHQSFGYEDFIEGIKAKVEPNGNINYEIKPGIFKSLCEVAESEDNVVSVQSNVDVDKVKVFKMSLGEAGVEDSIYDYCMENNVVALGFGDMDFTELDKKAKPKDIKEFIRKKDPNADTGFVVDAIFRFKSWMDTGDLVMISRGNLYLRAIGKVTSEYFYDENSPLEYKHFRKVEWLVKDVDIPVERINTKNFSQQSIYNLKDDGFKKETTLKLDELKKIIGVSKSTEKRNYVLIIDEINRGNISKIFGELITLIEPNKRLGNPEQIKVKLPYSQKEFGVPSNLFIIGTMNTADRSIALMDLALRRRFSFNEIEPDSSLLDGIIVDGINVKNLFETYNKRIEFLYDRDHLLGHAYFLPLKEEPTLGKLNHIVLDKVIPLLQEYFHDDWEKIQLVLGKGLIYSEDLVASDILGTNTSDYDDHPNYKINLNPSAGDYNI